MEKWRLSMSQTGGCQPPTGTKNPVSDVDLDVVEGP